MKFLIIIVLGQIPEDKRKFINELFFKMNVKMYNISFNILRNKFDAEEALAQTFLKIIENIEKISALPCPQMEAYCVIIVKNESINIIRKRKKIIHSEDVDYFYEYNGADQTWEEYLETINKEKLYSCIKRLSKDERNFIYLRFINEMKFKDISELLGITEETAKKRSQRILKKLRVYYGEGETDVQNGQ